MPGVGVFTTIRMRHGEAWFWSDHLERLRDGALEFGLDAPEPGELRRATARATAGLEDARVRVDLLPGGGWRVSAGPYLQPPAPWRLRPVLGWSPDEDTVRFKTTRREAYDRARRTAAGADDALLVGPRGEYLETSIANLFLIHGNTLLTPPASAPILAGIARTRVLAAARDARIPAREAGIDAETARSASACFVTNALLVVHPVVEIEGVAAWGEDPLARRLRRLARNR